MAVAEPVKVQIDLDFDLKTVLYDDGEGHAYTLADKVADRLAEQLKADAMQQLDWNPIRDRVRRLIDEEIAARVAAEFDRSMQPTDRFGQPTGPVTTLAEQVVQQATAWLNRRSDGVGSQTNMDKLVRGAIDNKVKGELAKAIETAKADVIQALQHEAGAALVAKVTRVL